MRSNVAESGFKQTMADKSLGTKTARFGAQLFGLCALLFIVCRIVCWVVFPGAWRIAALQDKSVIAVGVLSMVFVVGMFGGCLFVIGRIISRVRGEKPDLLSSLPNEKDDE